MYSNNHNLAVVFNRDSADRFNINQAFKTKWEKLLHEYESIQHGKGQVLYNEGNLARGVYYIRAGKVKLFKQGSNGKEQILKILQSGEFLGYTGVLTNTAHSNSASVLENALITFVPKAEFENLMHTDMEIAEEFTKMLCEDIRETEEKMVSMAYKPVRGRLAETLLDLDKLFRDKNTRRSNILLNREELANLVGTAKETVIRLLSEFKSEHLIRIQGKQINVIDPDGLIRINNLYN